VRKDVREFIKRLEAVAVNQLASLQERAEEREPGFVALGPRARESQSSQAIVPL